MLHDLITIEREKTNWEYYKTILKEAEPKSLILFYPFKRLFRIKPDFKEDVYIRNKFGVFNCGRTMESCLIACSDYEPEIIKYINYIKKGIFIDVGSHIGKYEVVLKKLRPDLKVWSFEPNLQTLNLQKQNIILNQADNTKFHYMAIGNDEGFINFKCDKNNPAKSSIGGDELIGITKIDRLTNKDIKVSCIKIDVEGNELEVLKGAEQTIRRDKPLLFFEVLPKVANTIGKFYHYLKPKGYLIRYIGNRNYVGIPKK